jgi:hypothetical protein
MSYQFPNFKVLALLKGTKELGVAHFIVDATHATSLIYFFGVFQQCV